MSRRRNMKIFYSQQGEDFFIFQNFINKKVEDGIFLEMGACDGVLYSNTLFFEKNLNFKGILIEPSNKYFQNLIKNRKKNICLNLAISEKEGESIMLGDEATGGLINSMTEKFKISHHKKSRTYSVKTKRLDSIFQENNISYIDLFTLDVEGGELNVLNSIDWEKVEIYFFCIELDNHNKEKDEKCREILKNNGFQLKLRMCINEFWENPNYSRKKLLYDKDLKENFKGCLMKHGYQKFTEKHCIPEINKKISEYIN